MVRRGCTIDPPVAVGLGVIARDGGLMAGPAELQNNRVALFEHAAALQEIPPVAVDGEQALLPVRLATGDSDGGGEVSSGMTGDFLELLSAARAIEINGEQPAGCGAELDAHRTHHAIHLADGVDVVATALRPVVEQRTSVVINGALLAVEGQQLPITGCVRDKGLPVHCSHPLVVGSRSGWAEGQRIEPAFPLAGFCHISGDVWLACPGAGLRPVAATQSQGGENLLERCPELRGCCGDPSLNGSQVNAFLLCPERQSFTDNPAVTVSALQADSAEVGEPNGRQPEAGVGERLVLCRGGCRRHLSEAFDITLHRRYGSV